MTGKRSYGDPCGVARALDLVGERWALLVVRELLLGPKRFTDLRAGLPGVSADVLSQRVRELEQAGIVRRAKLPPPAASRVYELTEWGRELEPVVLALGRWGSRAPLRAGADLSPDALMIALKTVFDPGRAGKRDLSVGIRVGEDRFVARVADGRLDLVREVSGQAEVWIEADPGTLAAVLWHGEPLGALKLEGDRGAAKAFLELFPAPVPALP